LRSLAKQKNNKELENLLTLYKEKEKSTEGYNCSDLSGLIQNDHQEKIKFIIENDLMVVEPENAKCLYTLLTAARNGNMQIIDALLAKGFDVNAEDAEGKVPLIEAAAKGQIEVVEMLTSNGADLDEYGSSALVAAAINGRIDVIEYLLSHIIDINSWGKSGYTSGRTPLSEAARAGQKETVKLLLLKGAGINSKNNNGRTALMTATLKGKAEIVHLLLSNGANIDQQDKDGNTALDLVSKARMQYNAIDYRDVYN